MTTTFREVPPPEPLAGTTSVWQVGGPDDLAPIRRAMTRAATPAPHAQPRGLLGLAATGTATAPAPVLTGAGERVGMVFSELATNALRHGRVPVRATLGRLPDGWLVLVEDAAAEAAPQVQPAGPARAGGHGLRLVTRLSGAAGWQRRDDVKCVWAEVGDDPPQDLVDQLRPGGHG